MFGQGNDEALANWLVMGTGRSVLLLSATAILTLSAYLYILGALHFDDNRLQHSSALLRDTTNFLGVIGAVGGAIIYFSMWFYWAHFDRSRRNMKRIWFFVLLLGIWFGSCFYYFLVYRPQVAAVAK
jgi:uncharacterized membrane protein